MLKLASTPRLSRSLLSTALLLSVLGACAPLAQSQRGASTAAVPSSQPTFWGYSAEPVARPSGATFWGYSAEAAVPSSQPTFWGYSAELVARPSGPTFWGFSAVPAVGPVAAVQPSHEPQAPIAAKR
jgi:hypothetical protein